LNYQTYTQQIVADGYWVPRLFRVCSNGRDRIGEEHAHSRGREVGVAPINYIELSREDEDKE
jgi:hypothetical protein